MGHLLLLMSGFFRAVFYMMILAGFGFMVSWAFLPNSTKDKIFEFTVLLPKILFLGWVSFMLAVALSVVGYGLILAVKAARKGLKASRGALPAISSKPNSMKG